ncbi:PHOMO B domain-containing protein [Mycena chlorophos]|uniref:PHOMO B domain-containing protein n=1 Tax=Mycena chlorophos TaxID=658473 RepID=A0A8H6WKW5_MYCCL|nr:PHOMO B domain-containing protein [Mycena chlorophos]
MRTPFTLSALCTVLSLVSASKPNYDTHNYYVVEHDSRHASLAEVSRALGVEVVERVGELADHWLVRIPKSLEGRSDVDRVLARHATLPREADVGAAIKHLSRQTLRRRTKRAPIPQEADETEGSRAAAQRFGIVDPLFKDQWHIINDEQPIHSMNVVPVWDMGYTGKGVITSFIDDGLDYTSEDLKDNFLAEFSHDYNDHEDLPTPKLGEDTHGTRCAGQVGAVKNTACGVGIAYDSKVAAVRILSGAITDADEAASLNYGYQNVSIYSCSWGPPDNGMVMDGPGHLIDKAVLNGINNGRGGKGSVFVFAAGNGAGSGDQCNFDGYTNSIYSVTVAAVDHNGDRPYYSEACTANLVAAYSSGNGKAITTTDKGVNRCTSAHGGTSAAAPNAAGVFALLLEARPDLTWRDVQHLCVQTARQIGSGDEWELTASGRNYSMGFGYGALDAAAIVQAAQTWQLVKPQTRMHTRTIQIEDGTMNPMGNFSGGEVIGVGGVSSTMSIKWDMLQDANLEKLEHITVRVWIEHTRRGDVRVELRSPNGVTSVLAEPRRMDSARSGFPGWRFMTVKHWGEDPVGDWMITVSDLANPEHTGRFLGWDMVFWGSTIDPEKAVLYDLVDALPLLPPNDEPTFHRPTKPSATKSFVRPTVYLTVTEHASSLSTSTPTPTANPEDLEDVPETTTTGAPSASESSSTKSQMTKIMDSLRTRLAVSLFALFILSFAAGVLCWRHFFRRDPEDEYMFLPPDASAPIAMTSTRSDASRGAPGAADEDSDDEADERTGLTSGPYQNAGVGYHSGFLDDDEDHEPEQHEYPPRAGAGDALVAPYRDEEERS